MLLALVEVPGLPVAAVDQFGEGFPLAGPCGRDRVAAGIGVADGDGPDGHPLFGHPVLGAEAGQGARDGARSAAFSSRSAVPGGSGSPVNARTILRRLMTSANSMPEA